jgi:prolyl-tRNA synthetase
MLQSKLFIKTEKLPPKDEVSINARLLIRGGFADKLMAGVYSLLPLGLRVFKKIETVIREEMEAVDARELIMPTLHPKENWMLTGRWDTMDDLYKLALDDNKEFALGPTHEEIIVPIAKRIISSYNDLPVYLYQFQNKFRNEKRAKSGVLRGREFVMKDLYSFHSSQEDLDSYYEKVKAAYHAIFKRCGIGEKTYLTYAAGGTFSKYSHEFQALTEAGEDLIYICGKCKVAINKEILDDQKNTCPECGNKELNEEKAVEVGNIFKLGTKFTEPFDLKYADTDGSSKNVIMGCYGIGLQRLMGTIAEIHHDDKGIIWPESVAPFKIHLIEVKSKNLEVKNKADKTYQELLNAGVETLYDDREGLNAGEMFADADLIGCPYRAVVSEKTIAQDSVELKKRSEKEPQLISTEKLLDLIK